MKLYRIQNDKLSINPFEMNNSMREDQLLSPPFNQHFFNRLYTLFIAGDVVFNISIALENHLRDDLR